MMPSIIPERLPVHPQEWAVKCLDMISGANHHHLHCLFQENNCIHNWNDSSGHSHYNFHIGTRMVSGGMSQSVLIQEPIFSQHVCKGLSSNCVTVMEVKRPFAKIIKK